MQYELKNWEPHKLASPEESPLGRIVQNIKNLAPEGSPLGRIVQNIKNLAPEGSSMGSGNVWIE